MIDKIEHKIHSHSNVLEFNKQEHEYTLDGVVLTPVTSMIGIFHDEFDTDSISAKYAEKRGLSEEERLDVVKGWEKVGKEAAALGSRVHDFAERYFYTKVKPSDGFERAVVKFWKELPKNIIPLVSEKRVFSEFLGYAGTIDVLFYNTLTNKIIIADYKTNKDIYKNFNGKTMKPPFQFLFDMPLSHYEIQLSSYQIPLNQIGIDVEERWIIWLKPTGEYDLLKTKDYTSLILKALNY